MRAAGLGQALGNDESQCLQAALSSPLNTLRSWHNLIIMIILPILITLAAIPTTCSAWQLPFLSPPPPSQHSSSPASDTNAEVFTLQHAVHINHRDRSLPPLHQRYTPQSLSALALASGHDTTQSIRLGRKIGQRPNDQQAFQAARRSSFYTPERVNSLGRVWAAGEMRDMALASTLEWDEVEVDVPDVSDPLTVGNLAKMSSNAYRTPDRPENWYELTQGWNIVSSSATPPLRAHTLTSCPPPPPERLVRMARGWHSRPCLGQCRQLHRRRLDQRHERGYCGWWRQQDRPERQDQRQPPLLLLLRQGQLDLDDSL